MKEYVTKKIDTEVLDYTQCDICKRKSKYSSWEIKEYRWATITVKKFDAYNFYESYESTETSFDICPDCFDNKLVPFLKSLNAEPTIKEEY